MGYISRIYLLLVVISCFLFNSCTLRSSQENNTKAPRNIEFPHNKEYTILNDSGVFYWRAKDYSKALSHFSKSLEIAGFNNNKSQIASSLNNIGLVYYSQGEYIKCLDYYNRSIGILREVKDSMKIAQSMMNTGIVYNRQGIYDKATGYLIEAARYFEKFDKKEQLASCYNSLANIQNELGYFREALKYHHKSLKIRKKINNRRRIASSLNNIGSTYKNMDSLHLALNYYNQSLAIKNLLGDKALIASTLSNIGEVNFRLGNYSLGENYFNRSLTLRKEINDQNGILTVSNKMGALYMKTGELAKAKKLIDLGYGIAKEIDSKNEALENLKLRTELFTKQKKMNAAIQNFYSYDSLQNLILSNEKIKSLTELRIKYEAEKNEKEISMLNELTVSQDGKLKAQKQVIVAFACSILMFLLLTIIAYRAYRLKQKSNLQIQVLMQERQHRAKNNLQIISELLGLQSGLATDKKAKEAIISGESRTQAVSLIDKMLYQNPDNIEINLPGYISNLSKNLILMFTGNKNNVKSTIETDPVSLDSFKATPLGLIINELITNSLKHAFKEQNSPEIFISLKKSGRETVILNYRDNGTGLPEDLKLGNTESLGLKLIGSLSKQLKGEFQFDGNPGFHFRLKFNV